MRQEQVEEWAETSTETKTTAIDFVGSATDSDFEGDVTNKTFICRVKKFVEDNSTK